MSYSSEQCDSEGRSRRGKKGRWESGCGTGCLPPTEETSSWCLERNSRWEGGIDAGKCERVRSTGSLALIKDL